MAWIRKKGKYHYVVASVRKNGSVRQEMLAYLGRQDNVPEALSYLIRRGWYLEGLLVSLPALMDKVRSLMPHDWGEWDVIQNRTSDWRMKRYRSAFIPTSKWLLQMRDLLVEAKTELESLPPKIAKLREAGRILEVEPVYEDGTPEFVDLREGWETWAGTKRPTMTELYADESAVADRREKMREFGDWAWEIHGKYWRGTHPPREMRWRLDSSA